MSEFASFEAIVPGNIKRVINNSEEYQHAIFEIEYRNHADR